MVILAYGFSHKRKCVVNQVIWFLERMFFCCNFYTRLKGLFTDYKWGPGNRLKAQEYGLFLAFIICPIPVAATVDFMVSLLDSIVPCFVKHFRPICDTIKSTLSAIGLEKIKSALSKPYIWAVDGFVYPPCKPCEQSFLMCDEKTV